MNISAILLLALCLVQQTFGNPVSVCKKDACKGTRTNPIPRGQQWYKVGVASEWRGCCAFKRGGCDYCAPKAYECYDQYDTDQQLAKNHRCWGLTEDTGAHDPQTCETNCDNDSSCSVWQYFSWYGGKCYRGQSNDCTGNNDELVAGGRKDHAKFCSKAGAPYAFQQIGDKNKAAYPGCGDCACCRALNPSYEPYVYQNDQNDDWCMTVGFPYVFAGWTTPHWGKLCGWYSCCKMIANPAAATEAEWALAIEAADEIEVAEEKDLAEAVFNTQQQRTSAPGTDIGVTALACVGFLFLTYGAYKHYSKN